MESMRKVKVCHLTSAHPVDDARIFYKECVSLHEEGYEVSLVVPNTEETIRNGVTIHSFIRQKKGRMHRFYTIVNLVYNRAVEIDADIYHLHDPELLSIALKLKRKTGAKVIFDSHEDVEKQLLNKIWIRRYQRTIIAFFYARFEKFICKRIDGVISVTPTICKRFSKINSKVELIANYPIIQSHLKEQVIEKKENSICYVGGLFRSRGILELVKSLDHCDAILHLAGLFESQEFEDEVRLTKGWQKVKYYGHVNREKINEILHFSNIGIVTLHPTPSYLEAYPIKLFEYMEAGIAILASDFPLYRELMEKYDCGHFVDPMDSIKIGSVITQMLNDKERTLNQGLNGIKAVKEKYNWRHEKKKLIDFYSKICPS